MNKGTKSYWILYDDERQMVAGTDVPILCSSRNQAASMRELYDRKNNYKPLQVWIVLAEPSAARGEE
jgi:hypothetical protein